VLAEDLGGLATLSDDEYEQLEPVQWPVPRGRARGGRLFGDGRFMHEDRKARFVPTPWRGPAAAPHAEHPLVLNTGRQRDQWHTMSRTGLVPRLARHASEPFLDIHPQDANELSLFEGGLVEARSRQGAGLLRVRLDSGQHRGEVFASMHWNDRFASSGPIDRLVGGDVDPVSGQPEFKATPVALRPRDALWQGLLLRRREIALVSTDIHWSRAAIDQGFAYRLTGAQPLTVAGGMPTSEWVSFMLGAGPGTDLAVYADPGRGVFRYAGFVGERLEACLFVGRDAASLPAPDALGGFLALSSLEAGRSRLLAGRLAGQRSTGPLICACFGVGREALVDAISRDGLDSVAAIGKALRAGTNCGSCVPELKALLATSVESDSR
jgi:assimilatory nitrate reductase catalytic subunit